MFVLLHQRFPMLQFFHQHNSQESAVVSKIWKVYGIIQKIQVTGFCDDNAPSPAAQSTKRFSD
jgi:hypothetical protein